MKKLLLLPIIMIVLESIAQTPFATRVNKSDARKFAKDVTVKLEEGDIEKADFFDHLNANVVTIQNGGKMFPTINGEVINYKLGLFTRKKYSTPEQKAKKNRDEKEEVYLPFSIITKVSGNYMDAEAGPTNDATSFFGAPLTFRFSPSVDCTPFWEKHKIFAGLYTDLRLLIIGDTAANKLESGWGSYISCGFSFMGNAYAYETDEAKRYDGKWSMSAMLYWFKSGGTFNKAVFGSYEKKSLAGIEVLLRFKANKKEDSKFNFLLGASNGFKKGAPDFAKWQIKMGIGS